MSLTVEHLSEDVPSVEPGPIKKHRSTWVCAIVRLSELVELSSKVPLIACFCLAASAMIAGEVDVILAEAVVAEEASSYARARVLYQKAAQLAAKGGDSSSLAAAKHGVSRMSEIVDAFTIPAKSFPKKIASRYSWAPRALLDNWLLGFTPITLEMDKGKTFCFDGEVENFHYRAPGMTAEFNSHEDNPSQALFDCIAGDYVTADYSHFSPPYDWRREYVVDFSLDIQLSGLVDGGVVKVWWPLPVKTDAQDGVKLLHFEPSGVLVSQPEYDAQLGCVCFELQASQVGKGLKARSQFLFRRAQVRYVVNPDDVGAYDKEGELYQTYTSLHGNTIVDADMRAKALELAGEETNPYRLARSVYDHVVGSIGYGNPPHAALGALGRETATFVHENGWGDGVAQSVYFVALCRYLGVPARTCVGYLFHVGAPEQHAWAEFYLPNYGWVPVDPRLAGIPAQVTDCPETLKTQFHDYYFGQLDPLRMEVQKDVDLLPPQTGANVDFPRLTLMEPWVDVVDSPDVVRTKKFFSVDLVSNSTDGALLLALKDGALVLDASEFGLSVFTAGMKFYLYDAVAGEKRKILMASSVSADGKTVTLTVPLNAGSVVCKIGCVASSKAKMLFAKRGLQVQGVDAAGSFSDGLCPVKIGGVWGYADQNGGLVITPSFLRARKFAYGRAAVQKDCFWGFIDTTGAFAAEPAFLYAGDFSEEGLAPVLTSDELWGYANTSGAVAITPTFHEARSFSSGLAAARMGALWGFIDTSGAWVIAPMYPNVRSFKGDRAFFASADGQGLWGVMDRSGAVVISPVFEGVGEVSAEGVAPVLASGKWGFVDSSGSYLFKERFEAVGPFSGGLAAAKKNGKWGYVDASGAWVIKPAFDGAGKFDPESSLAMVKDGDVWIDIDMSGAKVGKLEGLAAAAAMPEEQNRNFWIVDAETGKPLQGGLVMLIQEGREGEFPLCQINNGTNIEEQWRDEEIPIPTYKYFVVHGRTFWENGVLVGYHDRILDWSDLDGKTLTGKIYRKTYRPPLEMANVVLTPKTDQAIGLDLLRVEQTYMRFKQDVVDLDIDLNPNGFHVVGYKLLQSDKVPVASGSPFFHDLKVGDFWCEREAGQPAQNLSGRHHQGVRRRPLPAAFGHLRQPRSAGGSGLPVDQHAEGGQPGQVGHADARRHEVWNEHSPFRHERADRRRWQEGQDIDRHEGRLEEEYRLQG